MTKMIPLQKPKGKIKNLKQENISKEQKIRKHKEDPNI